MKLLDLDAGVIARLREALAEGGEDPLQDREWGQLRDGKNRDYRVAKDVPWRCDGYALVRLPAKGIPYLRAKANRLPFETRHVEHVLWRVSASTASPVAVERLGPVAVAAAGGGALPASTHLVVAVPGMQSARRGVYLDAVRLAALIRWSKADIVRPFAMKDGGSRDGVALLSRGSIVGVLMGVRHTRRGGFMRDLDVVLAEIGSGRFVGPREREERDLADTIGTNLAASGATS